MLRKIILAIMGILTLASCATRKSAQRAPRVMPEFSIKLADDIVFEIDPRIELLAAVQSQTSWVRGGRGPKGAGNRYFDEMSSFFKAFAGSPAVKSSQSLTDTGFSYDAPPAFALSLEGGSAFLPPAEGYSSYLKARAWGGWRLDSFRDALAAAYDASFFADFLDAHAADYGRWLAEASEGFDARALSSWLAAFYGSGVPVVYHFVLAPAMFPGGGYGFSRSVGEGDSRRLHAYQIVRAQGSPDGEPGFPSGRSLMSLALHEFGHSFVNPALEPGSKDRRLASIYAPVSKEMAAMAYGQASVFLNELVLRAVCILAERDLGISSEIDAEVALRAEHKRGFYPILRVAEILEEYCSDRRRYPDFASFAPLLLERLAVEAKGIVAKGKSEGYSGQGVSELPSVESFFEDFEGEGEGGHLPAGLSVDIGATSSGGSGAGSRLGFDLSTAASGAISYSFSADAGTSRWYSLGRRIAVKDGILRLRYMARGQDIRVEGGQFGGSCLGFIIFDSSGQRRFAVQRHSGSFPWSSFSVEEKIEAAATRSIEFLIFLKESGLLGVDDISIGYE